MPARRTTHLFAAAGAAALLATGCSYSTPVQTQTLYPAGDGARIELTSDVRGENIMVLAAGEGAEGAVFGALANDSADDLRITVEIDGGGGLSIDIPSGQSVLLGTDELVVVPAVPVPPGAYVDVVLEAEGIGAIRAEAPVLDGTLPQYADYVP